MPAQPGFFGGPFGRGGLPLHSTCSTVRTRTPRCGLVVHDTLMCMQKNVIHMGIMCTPGLGSSNVMMRLVMMKASDRRISCSGLWTTKLETNSSNEPPYEHMVFKMVEMSCLMGMPRY